MNMSRQIRIEQLRRSRPRRRFARYSLLVLVMLAASSWWVGNFSLEGFFSARRLQNLQRFMGELRPFPLQQQDFDLRVAVDWAAQVLAEKGAEAAWVTLAISIAAIVLAGALSAFLFSLPAARNIASPEPFLPAAQAAGRMVKWYWRIVVWGARSLLIFLRSIPELVWAFLFVAMIGPTPWAAVLALSLHNIGILGKLNAEAVEDLEKPTLAALRGLGATRSQIAMVGIFPAVLNRFLLYFFYRWETCVREATVLGMLGVVSLGYWIQDARARNHYDTMLFLVLMGALIVLIGDLISTLARRYLRRAV